MKFSALADSIVAKSVDRTRITQKNNMRFFYSLLMYLLWPLWLSITLAQSYRRQGGWRFLSERMSWSGLTIARREGESVIWMHAASVGELRSILPLLMEIVGDPKIRIAISINTPEAMRELQGFIANQHLGNRIYARYCAIDFYFATGRMASNIDAKALWVVETELWPNLFSRAKQQGMFVGILNGRLSGKTLNANRVVKAFYRQILANIDSIAARGSVDAQRFIELGSKGSDVNELGNLKRTAQLVDSKTTNPFEILSNRNYVLALSTREGEELLLWQGWQELKEPPLLVIAPRHVRRASDIIKEFQEKGVKLSVRSRGESILADTQVYLADTMGEAEQLAVGAQWIFVGGSLVDKGGHNVLEPALWGRYVVCGPFVTNIEDDVQWLKSLGCLRQIAVTEQAGQVFSDLLNGQVELEESCQLANKKLRDHNKKLLAAYKELCLNSLS